MRLPLVVGNWKMNGSRAQTRDLVAAIVADLPGEDAVEVAVCPPFVYLAEAEETCAGSALHTGGQNICDHDAGAFTGEISGDMLADVGCRFVIVGHSERRHIYGETDSLVAARYGAAQRHGLTPIFCVGETLEEREADATEAVLERQLRAVFDRLGDRALDDAVLAYEPVWAIGTGRTATPEQAQHSHAFLRALVAGVDAQRAGELRILYGGSVKPDNAAELFARPDVDGGLIGGAALKAEDFLAVCRATRSDA